MSNEIRGKSKIKMTQAQQQSRQFRLPTEVDLSKATPAQIQVIKEWSPMARELYNLAEITFPEEMRCNAFKKRINDIIYSTRNNLLIYFKDYNHDI